MPIPSRLPPPNGHDGNHPPFVVTRLLGSKPVPRSAPESLKAKHNIRSSLTKAETFARFCKATRGPRAVPEPVLEYVSIPGRKFRIDIAWPAYKVGIEIEGGMWKGGRVNLAKHNIHVVHGWRILYVVPSEVLKPSTLALAMEAIHGPPA